MIFLAFWCNSCSAQTINLKFRWDKNSEPDMKEYDLFRVIEPDCTALFNQSFWPNDTLQNVRIDSSVHYQGDHFFATVAHIFSPVDSLLFYYDQPMEQGFLRAYIIAIDSVGNYSYIAPSLNAVYIGDRDAPRKPGNHMVRFPK